MAVCLGFLNLLVLLLFAIEVRDGGRNICLVLALVYQNTKPQGSQDPPPPYQQDPNASPHLDDLEVPSVD